MGLLFLRCGRLRCTVRYAYALGGLSFEAAKLVESLFLVNFWPCLVSNDASFYLEECCTPGELFDSFRALGAEVAAGGSTLRCVVCRYSFPLACFSRRQVRMRRAQGPKCRACLSTERTTVAGSPCLPSDDTVVSVHAPSFRRFFQYVVRQVLVHDIGSFEAALVAPLADVLFREAADADAAIDFETLGPRTRRAHAQVLLVRRLVRDQPCFPSMPYILHSLLGRVAALERQVGRLIDASPRRCGVCMDDLVDIRCEPCGHELLCSACYARLPKPARCPFCRAPIASTQEV